MKLLTAIGVEIVGLFLDDAFMAVAVLGLAAATGFLAFVLHAPAVLSGAGLTIGCVVILVISTLRGARSR